MSGFFQPARFIDPFGNAVTVAYDRHRLLPARTRDAVGNGTTAENDYRVLRPVRVTDANGNRTAVAYDVLGLLAATAVMGKPGANVGDSLDGLDPDPPDVNAYLADPLADPTKMLAAATVRMLYDVFAYQRTANDARPRPPATYVATREAHHADVAAGTATLRMRHAFLYADGFGREVQTRTLAPPSADGTPQWLVSGWAVLNNKGKPVRRYESFFDTAAAFEAGRTTGVSSILCYDPLERVVATIRPDQTYEKQVFEPWRHATYDANDNVARLDPKQDEHVGDFFRRLPAADFPSSWYAQRTAAGASDAERAAAVKAAVHADTPTVAYFDALGRVIASVAHNRTPGPAGGPPADDACVTRHALDVQGNMLSIRDPLGRLVITYDNAANGAIVHQVGMDAGERWSLNDVAARPVYAWDGRGHRRRTTYDAARRPVETRLSVGGAAETVVLRMTYGESVADAQARNLRGRVAETRDDAGVTVNEQYDFKGNLVRSRRRLRAEYRQPADWSSNPPLEAESFVETARYDALDRITQRVAPFSDRPGAKASVVQKTYDESGHLRTLDAWPQQNAEPAGPLDPNTAPLHAVTAVAYNARGQRTRIDYGNGVHTAYDYDPATFRLLRLFTARPSGFSGDDPIPPAPPRGVQQLRYTYDPIGNITHVRDDAQQTIFFDNARVDPHNDFAYDALYQLIEATGREHLGQTANDAFDAGHSRLLLPGDGDAMGRYTQRYAYDKGGSIRSIEHRGALPTGNWTRRFEYDHPSRLESAAHGDRLSRTVTGNTPVIESYGYDAHGNTLRLSHLAAYADPLVPNLHWDFQDRLARADLPDGDTAYYVYDANGRRVRKVIESPDGGRRSERIDLVDVEVFRQHRGTYAGLVRQTLHIADDQRRVALIETRNDVDDGTPRRRVRFQLSRQPDACSLELDEQARVVSYEEYTPYGGTSYQATSGQTETPKRYRYAGRERDEESGLYCHGRRYYAPWLVRWLSCDPIGMRGGLNLYAYCGNNPVSRVDPGGTDWEACLPYISDGCSISSTASVVAGEAKDAAVYTGKVFRGAGTTLWGTAKGMYTVVRHPVQTAEGLWHAVTHPVQTAKAVGTAVKKMASDIASGDPDAIGGALAEAALLFVPADELAKASKVAKAAETADKVSDVARTVEKAATAAKAVDEAAEAAKVAQRVEGVAAKASAAAEDAASLKPGVSKTKPRFAADDAGNIVDTQATPPGRYMQPDRSATDILQKAEHPGLDPFTAHTHTHPIETHVNPRDPTKGTRKLGEPRAVTFEEVINIMTGKATRAAPKGR